MNLPVRVAGTPKRIICPACRALGSGQDCVERMNHVRQKPEANVRATEYDQPEYADLEVIVRYTLTVDVDEEPLRQKAQRLQDELTENAEALKEFTDEYGSYSSYDVQVLTPAEHG